ncbi:DUF1289 domain-containing protein [Paracidovorax avenae]|uniref:DUF1289 domain-containing protein n=1 Tax=Paracidovorax avenae TaxID=80867 RepID=UPI000D170901|nr:DUF1289 domain-containing protein [Paracidovorax avenae]AVS63519.1 DUF1289 domain-containing protein [Paracidovorax avenae]
MSRMARHALAERAAQISAAGGFAADGMAPVPSPCIGVCRMDAGGHHCEGCFRTLDEISAWSAAAPARQRAVWAALLQRAGLAPAGPRD